MRIRITLSSNRSPVRLPLNYNYYLTSLIYRLLGRSSRDYASFLHDVGYRRGHKRFKLFTYSQLQFGKFRLEPPEIVSLGSHIEWLISSPVAEFVEHLAQGLLSSGEVEVGGEWLQVERVETLSSPDFSDQMRFTCRSPIVASRPVERDGKLMAHYYRYDEPGLTEALCSNLSTKFKLLHGYSPGSSALTLSFDKNYIERREGNVYRLIDFKGTRIKGIFCPFTVEGSPGLIEVGYEAGFREKNSMGFGMVEATASRTRGDDDEC